MQKKILDHLSEVVLLFDQQLRLLYINTSGEILFADSARHLTGMTAQQLFKASTEVIVNDLQQCLETAEPLVDQWLDFYQLDRVIPVNLSATPIMQGQQVVEVLLELQQVDLHVRISREEQLLAQHNTARLLVRSMAHEIKNPLGGLRGAAQLLEAELTDPGLKEYTQIIISESDRLQALMDKMLGPNMMPQKAWLNIHEVLEHVRQLIQVEMPGQIKIVRDFDPSIPDIEADKNQLIQVVLNIVRNAVQALGQKGEIIMRTRIRRQMTIRRIRYKLSIQIDIVDNGPGIKPDMINQIFYPMITGRAEGTGLGLSIAQSLINLHHGMIECSSQPGETVFSILLPLEKFND